MLKQIQKYCIGSRRGQLLFRLVVEVGMMGRIIATDTAIDNETISGSVPSAFGIPRKPTFKFPSGMRCDSVACFPEPSVLHLWIWCL